MGEGDDFSSCAHGVGRSGVVVDELAGILARRQINGEGLTPISGRSGWLTPARNDTDRPSGITPGDS